MEVTRGQLIKVFMIWNHQYLIDPDSFDDVSDDQESAESQADYLIELIQKAQEAQKAPLPLDKS